MARENFIENRDCKEGMKKRKKNETKSTAATRNVLISGENKIIRLLQKHEIR